MNEAPQVRHKPRDFYLSLYDKSMNIKNKGQEYSSYSFKKMATVYNILIAYIFIILALIFFSLKFTYLIEKWILKGTSFINGISRTQFLLEIFLLIMLSRSSLLSYWLHYQYFYFYSSSLYLK